VRRRLVWILPLAVLGLLLGFVSGAQARPATRQSGNEACLACHTRPDLTLTLPSGETVSLVVDTAAFSGSVHAQEGLACVACHVGLDDFPHPEVSAQTRREFNVELYSACQGCHADEYERTLDSVHDRLRAGGQSQAAICTDCHGAHDVRRLTDPQASELLEAARTFIPQMCARCHSLIYDKYEDSVHGAALVGEGNPDVPTCIDCHGVHDIADPRTDTFRLQSPLICSECHTDPGRMEPYGLSTQVLNTYVADFHGTTVTIFERLTPDAPTNKPVCFDCHGVHDIQPVDDPQRGLQVRENLLVRCQGCHPDATTSFPDAWLSHYIPSAERTPLVFAVNLFYKIFIPGTLGGMAVIVVLDLNSRLRRRSRARREVSPPPASSTTQAEASRPQAPSPSTAAEGGDTPVASPQTQPDLQEPADE
jgi:hypothetical protein